MGIGLGDVVSAGTFGLGTELYEGISGQTAADAASSAAATQAASQQAALDYFMQSEALPQGLREGALSQLGGLYGISTTPVMDEAGNITSYDYSFGDPTGQQAMMDQAKASPFYQSQLETGREATARLGAGQGGFRGGSTATDVVGYEQNLANQAYQQQLQGLQGLAQMPSTAGQTAGMMSGIGQTLGQGQIAAAQAQQQGFGNMMNLGGQLGAAYMMSDIRMKTGVTKIGTTSHPYIDKYEWEWIPESGKTGKDKGYIAQEVEQVYPDLVITGDDGIKRINRDKLEEKLKELN